MNRIHNPALVLFTMIFLALFLIATQ